MTRPPHDEPTASSPEELREQIAGTRRELGATGQLLADRTDVTSRARERAAEAVRRLPQPVRDNRGAMIAAAAALLVAGVLVRLCAGAPEAEVGREVGSRHGAQAGKASKVAPPAGRPGPGFPSIRMAR
ncbi:DUF3618 domain-containing protein [Streptomyces phaeoluteigriseus]|uniref:DUF3618 domain-containing protein n=1 Tax=Streptomyces phaeoluteigriseus TaxID=114686 RepID=UPI00368CD84D